MANKWNEEIVVVVVYNTREIAWTDEYSVTIDKRNKYLDVAKENGQSHDVKGVMIL